MTLHRFITSEAIKIGQTQLQDAETLHQITKVLKMKQGDKIALCDGRGKQGVGIISFLEKAKINLTIEQISERETDVPKNVSLYVSILKRENMEWVVQKATEMGVNEIIPLISERTIKTGISIERLKKIAKEATEQSGRYYIPIIQEPKNLSNAIKNVGEAGKYFFHLEGRALNKINNNRSTSIALFVGPEGGWTDQECSYARENGCEIVMLSNLTLRAETAAIVATYAAINQ